MWVFKHPKPRRLRPPGLRWALSSLLLAIGTFAYAGSEIVATPRSEVRLVSDVKEVAPVSPFWLGLEFKLTPGWHTYWRNPGDAGLAPAIDWVLPEGFVAGEIRWPRPELFRSGRSTSFGYDDRVVLLTRVSPSPGASLNEPIAIEASARWLVCADVCIPETGKFFLQLGRAEKRPTLDRSGVEIIGRAAAQVPREQAAGARYRASQSQIELSVPLADGELPTRAWFYPYDYGVVDYSAPQPFRVAGDRLEMSLTRGELRSQRLGQLSGVLVVEFEGGKERTLIVRART